jgi:hypothetical protein
VITLWSHRKVSSWREKGKGGGWDALPDHLLNLPPHLSLFAAVVRTSGG